MEIIEVFLAIVIIMTLLFLALSIIIYITDCTIKLFLIWISSFLIAVVFSYLIDSNPIPFYFDLGLISLMTSIFFILRIEERSFNYKYFFGFIISIILMVFSEYLVNPINFSILQVLTSILAFVFIFVIFPKILYNKFILMKSIQYPLIFVFIIIYLLIAVLISSQLYIFLEGLSYFLFLVPFLLIFLFKAKIRAWIQHVANEKYAKKRLENHSMKKIKNFINDKLYLIFRWDEFTNEECEKLREFLMYKFHFSRIKGAQIFKSNDNEIKIINVSAKENLASVIINGTHEKIYLKINDDKIYNLDANIIEENGRLNIYKESIIIKPIEPIEPSDYYLCDKIDDVIINSRDINFENNNLQELQFMLVCANLKKEDILNKLSLCNTSYLAAFILIIPLLSGFIFPLSEALTKLESKIYNPSFINFENHFNNFLNILIQFNSPFATIIIVIIVIILIFYSDVLFFWFKLIMKKYAVIELIFWIIVGIIIIGYLIGSWIELSMLIEIIWSNVLLFIFAIFLMILSKFESERLNKQLIRNYKIIRNLNERIINDETTMTKHF